MTLKGEVIPDEWKAIFSGRVIEGKDELKLIKLEKTLDKSKSVR